ncbi:MAG: DUF421 domain-containing protein [Acidobacteriota bacterium]
MAAVFRAIFGYLFLVLMVRVVGRRPGKQMAPFDFVLIFFIGGLTLTGMVGNDRSLTNAFVQIITVASCHFVLILVRRRSTHFGLFLDGTPLVLFGRNRWYSETLSRESFSRDDVFAAVREKGLTDVNRISWAVLERSGAISVVPARESEHRDERPGQQENES